MDTWTRGESEEEECTFVTAWNLFGQVFESVSSCGIEIGYPLISQLSCSGSELEDNKDNIWLP